MTDRVTDSTIMPIIIPEYLPKVDDKFDSDFVVELLKVSDLSEDPPVERK